ncbi:MFS transporter [Pusillimonas noertemannii]|uniref:EmrB/QacA subfamily drug resistance transporter n=1 Tax=Pusillimonas noertemannii TaxID=305977 RepID=A0A2U1CPC4_9BURK|nr:MFS transporter [Pusillimonas noertemannii]NYT67068.1 MFS transporter [Pusillimonas noertemannii]PVY67742.1 EmrB/QacA subfamily drug resistance transporter [Pusillimonas noertemannii]TFL12726.1 MFS transporter [Pusillimonas noertemannii]
MRPDLSLTAILWVISAGFFMQTLDTTIVTTALPAMARSLRERPLDLQPVIIVYSFTMAVLTPASGWLGDRYGTRKIYFLSILVFALGSLLCAMSTTLSELIASRVIQGLGGSMLLPIGRLVILRNFPRDMYLPAITLASISGQAGILLGPLLGGWLSQSISWHWIFLINLPIGLACGAAVLLFLPREAQALRATPFDVPGFALLSCGMVAFSMALDGGRYEAWRVAILLACSAASIWLYVQLARRKAHPLFPLSLFRERAFSIGLAGNLAARLGGSAVFFLIPLLFQTELGYSPLQSGLMMLPIAAASMAVKRMIPLLIGRHGYGRFLMANTVCAGLSIIAFATIGTGTPSWLLLGLLSVFGAFNSMQNGAMNSVTLQGLPAKFASSGNGMFSMVQMLAVGLGAAAGGTLVKLFSNAGMDAVEAFQLTFVLLGSVTLASTVIFANLKQALHEGQRRSDPVD